MYNLTKFKRYLCLFFILFGTSLANAEDKCPFVIKNVLALMQEQSESLKSKNECAVGENELKINAYKKSYPACFKNNPLLNMDTEGYKFTNYDKCLIVKQKYIAVQKTINLYRSKSDKCKLGKSILQFKELMGNNLDCFIKKEATAK